MANQFFKDNNWVGWIFGGGILLFFIGSFFNFPQTYYSLSVKDASTAWHFTAISLMTVAAYSAYKMAKDEWEVNFTHSAIAIVSFVLSFFAAAGFTFNHA